MPSHQTANDIKFCLKAVMEPQYEHHTTTVKGFDFAHALSTIPECLEHVFQYLDYRDTVNAVKACGLWLDVAEFCLRKRMQPTLFGLSSQMAIQSSVNSRCIKPEFTLVLLNKDRIALHKYLCIHHGLSRAVKIPFLEFLYKHVVENKTSKLVVLSCRAIFGPNGFGRLSNYFNGITLPQIPNVNIKMFSVVNTKMQPNPMEQYVSKDEIVKCVFVQSLSVNTLLLRFLVRYFEKRQMAAFALCGGIVKGIKAFQKCDNQKTVGRDDIFCTVFTVPKDVPTDFDAYSVVVKSNKIEDLDEALCRLKGRSNLRKFSFIFRVNCISRKVHRAENDAFQKYFPSIDVFGYSGDGEIGKECLETEDEPPPKRGRPWRRFMHFGSTVLMLLTWGPVLKK